jgi:hypothetical protein
VDVPTEVVEAGLLIRRREATPGLIVQVEFIGNLIDGEFRSAVEVEPEQFRSTQPTGTIRQIFKMVNLVSIEEDRAQAPALLSDAAMAIPPGTQEESSNRHLRVPEGTPPARWGTSDQRNFLETGGPCDD